MVKIILQIIAGVIYNDCHGGDKGLGSGCPVAPLLVTLEEAYLEKYPPGKLLTTSSSEPRNDLPQKPS